MRRALLFSAAIAFAIACGDDINEPIPDRTPATPPTVAFATTTTEDGLSISTDKDDYQPGDTVHFTGTGWQPGDVLDIVLTDDPLTHDPHTWSVNVEADGMFHDSTYVVDEGDLDVTFTLVATSRATGRSLTVQFTDGVLRVNTSPSGITFLLSYTERVGAGCTGAVVATGTGTATVGPGTFQFQPNPANGNSVLLQAAANSSDTPQGAFISWTGPANSFDLGVPPRSICVKPFNGNQTFTAGYKAPNLTITKQAVGTFGLGENATYSLTVSNASGANIVSTAGTITVTDNLPSALNYVSASGSGWTCSAANDNLTCTTEDVINPGASAPSITLTVAVVGQNINNQTASVASGSGGEPAGNAGNNSFTVSTPVLPALASKLAFTTPTTPFSIQVGVCSPLLTVQTQTTNGLAVNQSAPLTVNLSSTSTGVSGGKFYSDAACAIQVTTRTIATNANSATFFYKDGTVGTPTLTASATGLNSATQVEEITAAPNAAPVAVNDAASTNEDVSVEIDVLANDIDELVANLGIVDLTQPIAGTGSVALSSGDKKVTYTPPANFFGTATFAYKASDGALQSSPATVTVTVNSVNDPPVLAGVPTSATIDELTAYTFDATASDVDLPAQTLTFNLVGAPVGAAINNSGHFSWTPSEEQGPGNYTFSVRVTDGTDDATSSITITVNEVNVPPTLTDVPSTADVDEMTNYTFDATATDPDLPAQTLTFSLVGGPAGATIDPTTGVFSWTPAENQGPGTYPFKVRVSDGMDNTDASITITVKEVNLPPVLGAVGDKTVNEGSPLTFIATASDPDLPANTLTFSLDGAPAGASIDPSSGAFSWTPADNTVATFKVVVTDDGLPLPHLSDDETITVTVLNVPPTISSVTANPSGQLVLGSNNQVSTTVTVAFSDPAGTLDEPYTTAIDCGNGTSASGNSTTHGSSAGVCTYTAAQVGFRTISATVTDNDGGVSAPKTTQVQVIYNWTGFFQPVDNDNLNLAKGGSAIPVKFNLGGNQGLLIFYVGDTYAYPNSSKVNCNDIHEDQDTIEETVNAGGSSLTYGGSQYIYVWKTEKAWVGQCRRLDMKLKDETTHSAYFKFKP